MFSQGCLTGYKSVDDKEWVCKSCVGALLSWKIPACSAANGFKFQEISQFELVHWKSGFKKITLL